MGKKQTAVYLDFENIAISAGEVYKGQHMPVKMEPIVSYAEAKGKLRVKKVYADWSKKKFSQYQKKLMIQGFDLVHLPETNLLGKNGSDMRLVIDVMDHIQTFPEIDTVIIGSGDSDFIPLLQYLQSKNKDVIIVGFEHSVSEVIKHYCTEFRSLEEIIGPPTKNPKPSQHQKIRARNLLHKVAKALGTEPVELTEVKKILLDIAPRYNPRSLGFASTKKMLKAFEGDLVEKIEKRPGKKLMITFSLTKGKRAKAKSEEEQIAEKKGQPGFKVAKNNLNAWLDEMELDPPLPLSRIKSGLLKMDQSFSEKKLGFNSFKQFALAMVNEVFDKIEVKDSTMLAYFPKRKPSANGAPANGASPGSANGIKVTKEQPQKITPKKPEKQQSATAEKREATSKTSTKPRTKPVSIIDQAKRTLKGDLHFLPDPIFRQSLAELLIKMFSKEEFLPMTTLKERLAKQTALNEGQIVKYLLTLKFGAALVSAEGHGNRGDKPLRLKEGISQSEALDFLYIEQISDVLKRKHPDLSNSQILDLLFS
jgi:uncharacterized LabA/DUF88 family protein